MGKAFYVVLGFALLFMISCEEERSACMEPTTVAMRVGCYTPADTGKAVVDTALPRPIIAGLFADSLKYWIAGNSDVQSFQLLLSPIADSCQWVVKTDTTAITPDTLTFYYSRKLQFLSNTCGYTYFYSLRDVHITHNSLDSVKISNTEVSSNASVEHIRLYF